MKEGGIVMDFGHVLTAMVTPFDSNGEVDYEKTSILVEHLLANGTEGLIVAGTTGESPTLSTEEKVQLFKHVVQVVNNRVPVIAGTGCYNTAASIALTKQAEACNVDGIMLVTPFYNNTNQLGLYNHFSHIAEATKLPIILYNIPGRSVINLNVESVVKLSKIDNIVALKEASGDLDQAAEIIENTHEDFSLYSGDDSATLPILSIGGKGVVSVASHIIGNVMKEIVESYFEGHIDRAAALHRKYLPIMQGLFAAPSPVPVKAALSMNNIDVGNVRLPLVHLTEIENSTLSKLIQSIEDVPSN